MKSRVALIALPIIAAIVLVVAPTRAGAWQSVDLSVTSEACETATVTAHNPENVKATVTSQTGDVFHVGDIIPAGGNLARSASGTGDLTVSLIVDFPDHSTASTVVHFTTCPPPSTTTTEPPSSTTTSTPTVPPVVQCLGEPPHERTAADDNLDACKPPTVTKPHFTG